LKECKNQEWLRQYTPGNPSQRGQWEDQRHAGRMMLQKTFKNYKCQIVQDRRRWKDLVEKAKTLHKELYNHKEKKKVKIKNSINHTLKADMREF
jgi:hypothetical protein